MSGVMLPLQECAYFAEAQTYHYEPAIATAGKQVLAAFDKYGRNLPRLNYIAETEVIVSLADDLANDAELLTAVSALDLDDWVKELSTANTAFNQRYLARNTDYAARPDGNFINQRELVIDAWQQLAGHITAHATLTSSDAYTKLVKEINTLIDQYNQLINNRSEGGKKSRQVMHRMLPIKRLSSVDDAHCFKGKPWLLPGFFVSR